QRDELRRNLGLDEPLPIQFLTYLGKVAVLDFGSSFIYHRPVMQVIGERLPNSLQLSIAALLVGLAIGVPLGVLAALARGRLPDHLIRLTSVVGHAIPTFWFGLLFVLVLGVQLRWFPVGSMNAIGKENDIIDRLWHMVGPVLTLSLGAISNYPRFLRTQMLEDVSQDYVRTAHSQGQRGRVQVTRDVRRREINPSETSLRRLLS